MTKTEQKISRFLTLVLRHDPAAIGLTLDAHGWAKNDDLLRCLQQHGQNLTLEGLQNIVNGSPQQRFSFSDDGSQVRASQGHSVDIGLKLSPQIPPQFLYHGTATRFMEFIEREGLKKMTRQHVHLSAKPRTAHESGNRHRQPIILEISAETMSHHGLKFFLSENGVWLTDSVPPDYLNRRFQL